MQTEKQENYDSKPATLEHISRVKDLLMYAAKEILSRAQKHDLSKLSGVEKEYFDKFTPLLQKSTYGSPEYAENMSKMKLALVEHYKNNSHHPEHYPNGVNDMDLFDLIEMFFDWKAATERHADGDMQKSISINQERFGMEPQLSNIFMNTMRRYL